MIRPGLTVIGPIDALARDWRMMKFHLECVAQATHRDDGSPVSPRERQHAAELLSMLECKEP